MSDSVAFYERFAPYYEAVYAEVDADEAVRQWLQLLTEEGTPTGGKLLDLGCGPGWHLEPWRQAGFTVSGLDVCPALLYRAAARNRGTDLYCADVRDTETLTPLRGQFNVAVSHFNFLNLFPSRELPDLLASIASVLAPGGLWITDFTCRAEPAPPHPHRIEEQVGPEEVRVTWTLKDQVLEEHLWLHLPEQVVALANAAGFTQIKLHGWQPDHPEHPWCDLEESGRVVMTAALP